jgi:threonyl-tRNA synthetase
MWLAPVQVVVATISEAAEGYAREAAEELKAAGLRVELDTRNEKINYKVREHSLQKVPVIAVVGAKEAEERKVALRRFGSQANEVVLLSDAARFLAEEALPPDLKRAAALKQAAE